MNVWGWFRSWKITDVPFSVCSCVMFPFSIRWLPENKAWFSLKYECHDEKALIRTDFDINFYFSFFGKISGIFHYFNESFVIDPLDDFDRHFAWLSKTPLLLKIGQSPWKLCMVEYLSVSVWFWDLRIFHFSTVFVTVDYVPLFNKVVALKPSLIWRRGSQNDRGWFPPARWWLCRSETAKIPLIPWPCKRYFAAD